MPQHAWDVIIPNPGESSRYDAQVCFRAHQGRRRDFLCEIPAEDERGELPLIRQCLFLEDEDVLLLRPLAGPEGPAMRYRVRFDMATLLLLEEVPGRYAPLAFRLVEVF